MSNFQLSWKQTIRFPKSNNYPGTALKISLSQPMVDLDQLQHRLISGAKESIVCSDAAAWLLSKLHKIQAVGKLLQSRGLE